MKNRLPFFPGNNIKTIMENKHLEFFNSVELRGIVGNSTINTVGGKRLARFSLVTEYGHRDKDGTCIIDTAWHQCTAWEDEKGGDVSLIRKGTIVHLKGRIRTYRFTNYDGTERNGYEIFVNKYEIEGQIEKDGISPQALN